MRSNKFASLISTELKTAIALSRKSNLERQFRDYMKAINLANSIIDQGDRNEKRR